MAEFNREQFEAEARAAAPPMPEDMRPAKDGLWDRTWFQWVFWIVVAALILAPWPVLR